MSAASAGLPESKGTGKVSAKQGGAGGQFCLHYAPPLYSPVAKLNHVYASLKILLGNEFFALA